jgi:hypothetical protein
LKVITDFGPTIAPAEPVGKISASASEAYRETIALELERRRNAMGIWQDLVDRYGFEDGYQSIQRFVGTLRGAAMPEARVIIETRPVEECQVRDANHKREQDQSIRDSGYRAKPITMAAKSGSDVESPSWAE